MKNESLWDIGDEIKALDELINIGQGELSDEHEELYKKLDIILSKKTDSYCEYVSKIESEIKIGKEKIDKIKDYIEYRKNAIDRLKSYAKSVLESMEIDKLNGKIHAIKLLAPRKRLEVYDETKIPIKFLRIKTEINKSKITESIKNGEAVEGATIIDGSRSIQFKMKPVGE